MYSASRPHVPWSLLGLNSPFCKMGLTSPSGNERTWIGSCINFIQTFLNIKTWLLSSSTEPRDAPGSSLLANPWEYTTLWPLSMSRTVSIELQNRSPTRVSIGYTNKVKGGASTVVTVHQALCFTGINLLATCSSSTGESAAMKPTFIDEEAMPEKLSNFSPVVQLGFEPRLVWVPVPCFWCNILQKKSQWAGSPKCPQKEHRALYFLVTDDRVSDDLYSFTGICVLSGSSKSVVNLYHFQNNDLKMFIWKSTSHLCFSNHEMV